MSEFKIYDKTLKFDRFIRKNIVNQIPAVNRDLRIHILDESYLLIKNMIKSIYTKGNIRIKNLIDVLVNITLLDYLLGSLKDIKNVNNLNLMHSLNDLTDIKNMVSSWKNTEEYKKNENK